MSDFPYNFHDALLMDFSVGPRREISIHVLLDPVWNRQQERTVRVRFGAVSNMETVASFFERIDRPDDPNRSIAEIESLKYLRRDVILLELSEIGPIEIRSRNVTMD